jgi:hypothetical protein
MKDDDDLDKLDELDKLIDSFFSSSEMDRVNDYIQRGRPHEGLNDNDLIAYWKAAFSTMAADPSNPAVRRNEDDFASELQLRHIEIPYRSLGPILEVWLSNTRKLIDEIWADAEKMDEIQEGIASELERFIDVRGHSIN